MGESRNAEQFAAKMFAAGAAIGVANSQAVRAASRAAKATISAAGAADSGGDLKLSRWGRNGIQLYVNYRIRDEGRDRTVSVVRPGPVGPWRVLNDGAQPHPIVPGATRTGRRAGSPVMVGKMGPSMGASAIAGARPRRRRGRILSFGPGEAAAYAHHPGSRGKGTWTKGATAARPVAVTTWQKAHRAALVGAFR